MDYNYWKLPIFILFAELIVCQDNPGGSCLDAKYHKYAPGPEDDLFKQCYPWKDHSCCTHATTKALHMNELYSLSYDHCTNRGVLSEACKRHFTQDHCLYECSPNVGPWIVQEPNRTWRNERFFGVPLCASDCDQWFEDCRNDYTCTDNWAQNFEWVTPTDGSKCKNGARTCRVNVCPAGSSCITFAQMFGSAKNLCEKVWDGSWRYTSDSSPCFRLWFNGTAGNPNNAVRRYYEEHPVYVGAATSVWNGWLSSVGVLAPAALGGVYAWSGGLAL